MTIKYLTKQYAGVLPDIFEKKTPFLRVFGGLQVKSDAEYNEDFLTLKITDTDVTIQEYDKGANVAFGTGTGNSSRFGPRKEVKSVDVTVPWEEPLAIHEGVDKFTVNDIPEDVVAERLVLNAIAWAEYANGWLGKAINEAASATITEALTEDGVTAMFAKAHKAFVNNKVRSTLTKVAFVKADVFNFLVDNKLATTAKGSTANVENQTIYKFKGFELEELSDDQFEEGADVYFTALNIGVAGVGIEVVRALNSEDFNGTAIQGAGQYAKYIPEKNKLAILKGVATAETEVGG